MRPACFVCVGLALLILWILILLLLLFFYVFPSRQHSTWLRYFIDLLIYSHLHSRNTHTHTHTSSAGGKTPTINSPCECDYAGTLIDGTEFDSSYKRGQPLTFAPNQVIKGWTEAMQLMTEGAKWELYIPSELAYGDRGAGGMIPGGAALLFTLELLKVRDVVAEKIM